MSKAIYDGLIFNYFNKLSWTVTKLFERVFLELND